MKQKILRKSSSFFSLIGVGFILLFVLSLHGTITGKAVFVFDDDVTADQIAAIANLAGPGDETKMLSEISLDAGGYIIFSNLDEGDTAKIREDEGNIYVSGNVNDAVSVLEQTDYKQLLEDYGTLEIVNGELVLEEEKIDETEEVVEVEETEEVVEEVEDIVEEEQIAEPEPTTPYCKQTEKGLKGWSTVTGGAFSYENSCGKIDTREYATIYSCGSYDRGARWGGVQYYPQSVETFCRYGCADGQCQEAEDVLEFSDTCIDSDGGDAFDTPGSVTIDGEVYEDTCAEDSDFVYEYSCSESGNLRKVKQECQYICESYTNANCYGGYTKGSPTVLISGDEACEDSDAGDLYDGVGRAGTVTLNGESYADFCEGGKSLIEYSCVDGKELGKKRYTCSYDCADNVCPQFYSTKVEVLLPVQEKVTGDCEETASGVTGTGTKGKTVTYENYCGTYATGIGAGTQYYVNSAYCDENNFPALRSYDCPEGYVCATDGYYCVEAPKYCEDYDGGTNVYEASAVQADSGMYYDECSADKTSLTEWTCSADNEPVSEQITCASGCDYNACIGTGYYECTDTDGGLLAEMPGSVAMMKVDGTYDDFDDSCVDTKTVLDYTCTETEEGASYTTTQVSCAGICENGYCQEAVMTVDAFMDAFMQQSAPTVVIGANAPTEALLGAIKFASVFGADVVKDTSVVSDGYYSGYGGYYISLGTGEQNTLSAYALQGRAVADAYTVYYDGNRGLYVLVVAGQTPKETRKAARELVKYT